MNLIDKVRIVQGSPIIGALATTNGDCDYVSLKGYNHVTAILTIDGGTSPTGTAVTLKQATAVAGTSEKALAFTKVWVNLDTAAGDTLTETAVTSNTFTSATTSDKVEMYVMEINAADLDVSGGFDCFRVDCLLMATAVGTVTYILSEGRYNPSTTAITD